MKYLNAIFILIAVGLIAWGIYDTTLPREKWGSAFPRDRYSKLFDNDK